MMLCYIFIFSLIFSFASTQGITISTKDFDLRRTGSTYGLYMNSDAYTEKNIPLPFNYPNGFFIANLENKNPDVAGGFGSITVKIINNDPQKNKEKVLVYCFASDLSSVNEGFALVCDNSEEYDSIELNPQEEDSIKIEGIGKIKISDSVIIDDSPEEKTESPTETEIESTTETKEESTSETKEESTTEIKTENAAEKESTTETKTESPTETKIESTTETKKENTAETKEENNTPEINGSTLIEFGRKYLFFLLALTMII